MKLYPNSVTIIPHENNMREVEDGMYYVDLYNLATETRTYILCPTHSAALKIFEAIVKYSVYTN